MPKKKWPLPKKSDTADNQDLFEDKLEPGDIEVLTEPVVGQGHAISLGVEASEEMIRGWIDAARTKEAGLVLSWLNANGCLAFGSLPKALAGIEAGEHRS